MRRVLWRAAPQCGLCKQVREWPQHWHSLCLPLQVTPAGSRRFGTRGWGWPSFTQLSFTCSTFQLSTTLGLQKFSSGVREEWIWLNLVWMGPWQLLGMAAQLRRREIPEPCGGQESLGSGKWQARENEGTHHPKMKNCSVAINWKWQRFPVHCSSNGLK